MQLLLLLWALTQPGPAMHLAHGAALPACAAPSTRAYVRAAVEQQLTLQGVPPPAETFKLLDGLADATSPISKAIAAQVRQTITAPLTAINVCEVNDKRLDAPVFITLFVDGPGIAQPSGYVLNFGLPGAVALIGNPPSR